MGRSGHFFFLFLHFLTSHVYLFPLVCEHLKSISTCTGHTLVIVNDGIPSGHFTSMQRRIDVNAVCQRCIDVDTTLLNAG